ncbi:TRAP transporter substrate-binding protein [Paralcaligenes sp. KSB-10]|uniref:TRAP transporter substrate-binding protein n=1 Tax=Paralcaligenes sp. KSB-10 TaxID=2901142 RepID=UPI001E2888CC|nr:TRAP transporter substrate-binding protein [Paralcaligenes sp. KSB-10]UHL63186.1 TRAP transporter substrate-binding protein [Paralcaligenes sp. KSB-10]
MTTISRRRFLQTASAASLAATIGIPSLARAQAPVRLRVSSSMPADQNASLHVWYQHLADNLKAGVGEGIKLDYFPNNQLGKESDVVQQVKIGSTDMMVSGASIWATVAPELGMLDLGYLFNSFDHVHEVLNGQVGAKLSEVLQRRSGCTILAWAPQFGSRNVFTKHPVRSLAEIKGVKLRVLPTPAFIETFKAMGAVPTPLPFGEMYMAVQTGVVDGMEHDAATVITSKLNEVVKSCWQTQHVFSPLVAVMGKRSLAKIPEALRPAFMKAVHDATEQQRPIAAQKSEQANQQLKQQGMTFFPMVQAEHDAVHRKLQDTAYTSFAKKYPVTAPLFAAVASAKG